MLWLLWALDFGAAVDADTVPTVLEAFVIEVFPASASVFAVSAIEAMFSAVVLGNDVMPILWARACVLEINELPCCRET